VHAKRVVGRPYFHWTLRWLFDVPQLHLDWDTGEVVDLCKEFLGKDGYSTGSVELDHDAGLPAVYVDSDREVALSAPRFEMVWLVLLGGECVGLYDGGRFKCFFRHGAIFFKSDHAIPLHAIPLEKNIGNGIKWGITPPIWIDATPFPHPIPE
jgi:hypothetical protein